MKNLILLILFVAGLTAASAAKADGKLLAQCSSSGVVAEKVWTISFKRMRTSAVPTRGDAFYLIDVYNTGSTTPAASLKIDAHDVNMGISGRDGSLVALWSKSNDENAEIDVELAGRASKLTITLPEADPRASALNVRETRTISCLVPQ